MPVRPDRAASRAVRSSPSCAPETMSTCSAVHFTPRDVFRYSATASRSGRYPSVSPPARSLVEARRSRRAATCAHSVVGNRSSAGWFARNARTGCARPRAKRLQALAYAESEIRRCGRRPSWRALAGLQQLFGQNLADVGARTGPALDIAFGLQLFERGDDRSRAKAGNSLPRSRVAGSRAPGLQASVENRGAQLFVEPAIETGAGPGRQAGSRAGSGFAQAYEKSGMPRSIR